MDGSSPLTRGKPGECDADCQGRRLIPAHAGKTTLSGRYQAGTTAHPRSRGENVLTAQYSPPAGGSSPLTRGKLENHAKFNRTGRLIPAHAGKTGGQPVISSPTRAHPRSRGENFLSSYLLIIGDGSSPLTRGKRRYSSQWQTGSRLIPAHAGKTLPDLRFYCADRSDLGNP